MAALAVLTVLGLALTLAGLGARLDWRLELATHFRVQLGLVLGVMALGLVLLGSPSWAGLAAIGAALNLVAVASLYAPVEDAGRLDDKPLRVLLANVQRKSRDFDAVTRLIRSENPDLAVLIELDQAWLDALAPPLDAAYPFRHAVPRQDDFGLAILSRQPILMTATHRLGVMGLPALEARVATGGVPVTVLAAHPPPPMSEDAAAERNRALDELALLVRRSASPALLCADLNATPWSPYFEDLLRDANLQDARRGFGLEVTWPAALPPPAMIPIDHCLATVDLAVRDFRAGSPFGSDHRPVVVDLAVPRVP